MVDLDNLSREIAATSDAVRLAIAAVKANPPSPDSPTPWKAQPRRHEVIGAVAAPVADTLNSADAAHIAAAVNAAPLLIAEVERLQGLLPHAAECAALADLHILCADAGIAPGHIVERVRVLVERLAAARVAVGKMRTGHRHDCACCQPFLDRGCDCGEELIATARLALGLEAKP